MKPWQIRLEGTLSDANAPAVLDRDLLKRYAKQARDEPVPASTLTHWLVGAKLRGRLLPVIRGVYLNAFRPKPGRPADAAHFLRRDAVVSLNTVLGDAGVLNNPTRAVTAVVPMDTGAAPPKLGRMQTEAGVLHFFGVPRHVMERGETTDNLDSSPLFEHARATPERALVDWLYLAQSRYSGRAAPAPGDLDLEMLDWARLKRLAKAVGVDLSALGRGA